MGWNKIVHDFGDVKAKERIAFTFVLEDKDSEVLSVRCGCGCSTPIISGNNVTINFTAPVVPAQVKVSGREYIDSVKRCTARYKNSKTGKMDTQVLTFKGKVYPKK